MGVVTCRRECAIVGAWAWLCVSVGALLWRLWVVGCRRYVADDESELIGINQNQSEKIGLILISSDKLRLVPIVPQRQVYVAKARTNKGKGALRVWRSFVEKWG